MIEIVFLALHISIRIEYEARPIAYLIIMPVVHELRAIHQLFCGHRNILFICCLPETTSPVGVQVIFFLGDLTSPLKESFMEDKTLFEYLAQKRTIYTPL